MINRNNELHSNILTIVYDLSYLTYKIRLLRRRRKIFGSFTRVVALKFINSPYNSLSDVLL